MARWRFCILKQLALATTLAIFGFGSPTSVAYAQDASPEQMVPASSMVNLEHQDRKSRLMRLSNLQGILPPEFFETFVTPSQHGLKDYPVDIPVLRVVFSDQAFFDF